MKYSPSNMGHTTTGHQFLDEHDPATHDHSAMSMAEGIEPFEALKPDDLHYPMTMAALDAGLHVICEKPMALNAG